MDSRKAILTFGFSNKIDKDLDDVRAGAHRVQTMLVNSLVDADMDAQKLATADLTPTGRARQRAELSKQALAKVREIRLMPEYKNLVNRRNELANRLARDVNELVEQHDDDQREVRQYVLQHFESRKAELLRKGIEPGDVEHHAQQDAEQLIADGIAAGNSAYLGAVLRDPVQGRFPGLGDVNKLRLAWLRATDEAAAERLEGLDRDVAILETGAADVERGIKETFMLDRSSPTPQTAQTAEQRAAETRALLEAEQQQNNAAASESADAATVG